MAAAGAEQGSSPEGTLAVISRRAADRLRRGHLWVYRSDLDATEGPEPAPGELVTVVDSRRLPLGTGTYSTASEIAIRLFSPDPGIPRSAFLAAIRTRVAAALRLRDDLAPISEENSARRLVFSEADGLPGIVADQYNDLVVLQLLTQGTAREDVRAAVVGGLAEVFGADRAGTVWERPDQRIREREQLGPAPTDALWACGEPKINTEFRINGLSFLFDVGAGQKTGAFLDQRLNYAAVARHARGRGLDVCTYQGGFALHLAQVCDRVTGVDASRAALEVADRNLERNAAAGRLRAEVDWIEADAFELLRAFDAAGERFDTVVLDPPAFAKSHRAAEGAMRGYKELNLRALRLLTPGGTLVTCSCSHHIPLAEFTAMLEAAAVDARRRVQLLEVRGAAPDHPAILALPETSYLKCLICRVG